MTLSRERLRGTAARLPMEWPKVATASLALALAAAISASPAWAQADNNRQAGQTQSAQMENTDRANPPVIAIGDWNYDRIYGTGWSLERLLDEAEVYGGNGDDIGDLENVLISDDGKVQAVIAEVGGFIDIGDTHVAVPWDRLYISPDLETVETPVLEDDVEDYSPFKEVIGKKGAGDMKTVSSDLATGPKVWKATRLLDEYAYLPNGEPFGYIDDLIFVGPQLHAVVVSSDAAYGGGFVAVPYRADGYDAQRHRYDVGYDQDEVEQLDEFDRDQMADDADTGTMEQNRVRNDRAGNQRNAGNDRQAAAMTDADAGNIDKAQNDRRGSDDRAASGPGGEDATSLTVTESDKYGPYLTDQVGRSVYLFKADTQGKGDAKAKSACYDKCAKAWPPLRVSEKKDTGDRVNKEKLGVLEREDGIHQVTYNGWPLYYFVKDEEPGDTKGQDVEGFGAEWYLVTPAGKTAHGEDHDEHHHDRDENKS